MGFLRRLFGSSETKTYKPKTRVRSLLLLLSVCVFPLAGCSGDSSGGMLTPPAPYRLIVLVTNQDNANETIFDLGEPIRFFVFLENDSPDTVTLISETMCLPNARITASDGTVVYLHYRDGQCGAIPSRLEIPAGTTQGTPIDWTQVDANGDQVLSGSYGVEMSVTTLDGTTFWSGRVAFNIQ